MRVDLPLPLGPHDGDYFAEVDIEVDAAEGAHFHVAHGVCFGEVDGFDDGNGVVRGLGAVWVCLVGDLIEHAFWGSFWFLVFSNFVRTQNVVYLRRATKGRSTSFCPRRAAKGREEHLNTFLSAKGREEHLNTFLSAKGREEHLNTFLSAEGQGEHLCHRRLWLWNRRVRREMARF